MAAAGPGRLAGGLRWAASWRPRSDDAAFTLLGWLAMLLVVGTGVGLVWLLLRRTATWPPPTSSWPAPSRASSAAVIAAPIAASLFGGVTGSGADFVIAAFRQAGADLEQAVLGQSLVSDSIDKVVTYFVVYVILGTLAVRTKARFPQGERLLPVDPPTRTRRCDGAHDVGQPGALSAPCRPGWAWPGRPPGTASTRSPG